MSEVAIKLDEQGRGKVFIDGHEMQNVVGLTLIVEPKCFPIVKLTLMNVKVDATCYVVNKYTTEE